MKKPFLSIFMMLVIFGMCVACGSNKNDADNTTEAEKDAVTITGLSYSEKGTTDEFKVEGKIASNCELDRIECDVVMVSKALGGLSVSATAEPYIFSEGVKEVELSSVGNYFIDQYTDFTNLYNTTAGILGMENEMNAEMECTCYDKEGKSVNFTIDYIIVTE